MKVLVDTSVWSLALRRARPAKVESAGLSRLIEEGRVVMIGPVRQELLSGISRPAQFEQLKSDLEAFEDLPLKTRHFEAAAEFHNTCRRRGVQGSHTDFLLCAVAALEKLQIYTTDRDFGRFTTLLPFKLFQTQ